MKIVKIIPVGVAHLKESRLNVGDLVRDHFGRLYILIKVLEKPKNWPLTYGSPWRYVASHVTPQPQLKQQQSKFKEQGLILVRRHKQE